MMEESSNEELPQNSEVRGGPCRALRLLNNLSTQKCAYDQRVFFDRSQCNFSLDDSVLPSSLLPSLTVLVAGVGGTGSEVLSQVASTGFGHIDIVDYDRIELSNLNRQFLFRKEDVGRFKAEVAAATITKQFPATRVVPHCCRVEDLPTSFFNKFDAIFLCLDNIESRLYLNKILVSLVRWNIIRDSSGFLYEPLYFIPFVDLGVEKLMCSCRVVGFLPSRDGHVHRSSCLSCVQIFSQTPTVQFCTPAGILRTREQCVVRAKAELNSEPAEHGRNETSSERDERVIEETVRIAEIAEGLRRMHGIALDEPPIDVPFVRRTLHLTVPTLPFTNALVAAQGVQKILWCLFGTGAPGSDGKSFPSFCTPLEQHSQFSGGAFFFSSITMAPNDNCPHCIVPKQHLDLTPSVTAQGLWELVEVHPAYVSWKNENLQNTCVLSDTKKCFKMTLMWCGSEYDILRLSDCKITQLIGICDEKEEKLSASDIPALMWIVIAMNNSSHLIKFLLNFIC